jgi:hypothetical protein
MTLVLVFSRASAFSIRTSSFVHARNFLGFAAFVVPVTFFAISVPHAPMLPTNRGHHNSKSAPQRAFHLSPNLPKPTNKHAV